MECLLFALVVSVPACHARAPEPRENPTRHAGEEVNSAALRERPGLRPSDQMLFNGWGITPAGQQVQTSDMPLKLVLSPDGKLLAAACAGYNHTGVALLDVTSRKVVQFIPLEKVWNGLAFSKDGKRLYVSGSDSGQIYVYNIESGKAVEEKRAKPSSEAGQVFLAALALQPETGKLYVCNEANHEIWVVNPDTLALETRIPVGLHPIACTFGADRRHLYVSDWGSRSVSVVDSRTNRRVRDIGVGVRPNESALAPDGRLFVACSGDNTVHVIQTEALETEQPAASRSRRPPEGTREIIDTSLYPESPEGSTPDAVAVSPDGKTLFVANADNNDVLVVDISNALSESARRNRESVSVVNGFIPVGWYPTALCVSADNQMLFVANGKGLHSWSNVTSEQAQAKRAGKKPPYTYIANLFEGAISFINRPDAAQIAAYTEQVRRNSAYQPAWMHTAAVPSHSVIPAQVGQPCPIKYVLYIIKENRTYDQVFGDMRDVQGQPLGNGDSNLTMYGESVTPNQHQLAREYVLLDNLYCNGEVSVDGHSWCDAAIATDFNQRSWITSYSKHSRLPGNAEMETPSAGYLWDLCRRHGISFKNYGEGAFHVPSANRGLWTGQRDMDKVTHWINDLHAAEQTGSLPQFTIMSLGENHTKGTTPGAFTPEACVASNDLGLGKLVSAATHSKFWPEMAIFVIEDDAQNGPDHVDAHRTAGLVLSPYCKRGCVDSTLYTTASMVRTMELILGLPPLTQFDAGATPMFNCFQETPSMVAFEALNPTVDLFAKNTLKSPGAKQSARMDFREYDHAPEDELNRILWAEAKGPGVPYPAPIHRALFPAE